MNCGCSIAVPGDRGPLAPYLSYWSIVTRPLAKHNPVALPGPRSGKRCIPRIVSWMRITVFSWPFQAAKGSLRNRNQDAKAKPSSRRHLLRRHRSLRGELPGSGVTSSTSHRAGPSVHDPAGTFLPNSARCRPELVAALDRVYPVRAKEIG